MRIVSGNLNRRPPHTRRPVVWLCATAILLGRFSAPAIAGVAPDSPEVRKLVDAGLAYLETHTDNRLGGKCLLGLAFLKAGRGEHVRVAEAVEACQVEMQANHGDDGLDVYSNGLAVILLCEASPQRYARQIEWYLERLKKRQKEHGGWGYATLTTGDTSQSQYGALSYWEANRHGFSIDGTSVDNLADWLLRTQDPDGCWGYQGIPSTTDTPIPQDDPNCSMLAAGLGSLYICADLFDMHAKPVVQKQKPTETRSENPRRCVARRVASRRPVGAQQRAQAFSPPTRERQQDPANHGTGSRLDGQELQN